MANTWDVTDLALTQQLQAMRANWFNAADFEIHLFKNDYSPVPGMILSDLVEADFLGYNFGILDPAGWGSITVTGHIAQSVNATITPFTASAAMPGAQTIYGYYVLNGAGTLVYAERFETSRVVVADDEIRLRSIFRYKTST